MTRDEAVKIVNRLWGTRADPNCLCGCCTITFLDVVEKLGMLKLEEPKSANNMAMGALVGRCRMSSAHGGDCITFSKPEADRIIELLNLAHLKIVSK